MTTLELTQYYANLLILQYLEKPKAYATIEAVTSLSIMPQITVQEINFSAVPSSGTFTLAFNGNTSGTINWNDPASTIQTTLQTMPGLSEITVTGSIASQNLIVMFIGVFPPTPGLSVVTNTLGVSITILETDITLPLAVQNAFALGTATGVQLDILGKYAGVTRMGSGLDGTPITLDDTDFTAFIKMAIIQNTSGSSLASIQQFIATAFPGALLVYDYKDMRMSYFLDSAIGSQQLAQIFVTSNKLPIPMGVQVGAIIYVPNITTLFGFGSYPTPAYNNSPFNTYSSYNMNWPWLNYNDALLLTT